MVGAREGAYVGENVGEALPGVIDAAVVEPGAVGLGMVLPTTVESGPPPVVETASSQKEKAEFHTQRPTHRAESMIAQHG